MTNHWIDFKNSDCILIMGSNAAENHPICWKWVNKAQEAGGMVIHVDPRYTRTSAKSDLYAPVRCGSDIGFLGGMIKYILDNNLYFKDYVLNYTNASFIVGKDYGFKDGIFSGYDEAARKYDKKSWGFEMDENGVPKRDMTLKDPRCVFQILKAHYARYDVKNVVAITGTPEDKLMAVYKAFAATGRPDKSGTILYAMGWTQHTVGVQNVRAMAIIQSLLGNMGMAGGGVNALRGESNVQGSTDQALLFHIIPGYMPAPRATWPTLDDYNATTPVSKDPKSVNWWQNRPKFLASLLKSMYKDADLTTAYSWMPKLDAGQNASWLVLFDHMLKGKFKGFFSWGMNPAASSADSNKTREALAQLDWMVNVNIFENETGSFWKGPGVDPKKIKTEVFFLPCCVSVEKEGSVTNSGRWKQWRYVGPTPAGQTKPDGDIIYELTLKIRELYKKEGGAFPEPVLGLNVDDWGDGHVFDPHKVAKLMNGYYLKDTVIKAADGTETVMKAGSQVATFAHLQADGSTCCGNWVYAGSYTDKGNMAARRDKTQTPEQEKIGLFPNWTWCWPVNRRIVYNRASVDLEGKPYQPNKPVLAWDAANKKWSIDVVDGGGDAGAKHPFIMHPHGLAAIYGPATMNDGPLPEHYEPLECPVTEHPFSKQLNSPVALLFADEAHKRTTCDPRFPFVCTTYRVTEHWQTGVLTRWLPWLTEAEPQMFCEMSEELAELKGIKNGERVILENPRGQLWAIAIVTKRFKPYEVMGNTVHVIGIPWHYGWVWPKDGGDSANLLTPAVGDPNTFIPESKAFMVNVKKA